MNDMELEIKLNLNKGQFFQLCAKFDSAGYERTCKSQIDVYYSPAGDNYFSDTVNDKCLRIRHEGDKCTLTYKQIFSPDSELHSHMIEYETLIGSAEQMEKILEVLLVERVLEIRKERYKYAIDQRFEVSLDYVDSIGYFIEIEALLGDNEDSIEDVNKRLIKFTESLDVDIRNRNAVGYSNLAYRQLKQDNL